MTIERTSLSVETNDAAETQALGAALARLLTGGNVVALVGELGAGKTAFTQGLGLALGIRQSITSPTFTLINQYHTPGGHTLQHVDCYRLDHAAAEMWHAGLSDLFDADDIVVVEWADRIIGLLPETYLEIAFEYLDVTRRRITFTAHGEYYRSVLEQLHAPRP